MDTLTYLPKPLIPSRDIFVSSVCSYLPEDIVTNEEFVKRSGLTTGLLSRAQWIEARTGIKQRHWAKVDQSCSDIAAEAAQVLFKRFPVIKESVRHLILASISGDYPSPPTSPRLQHKIGLHGCATYDLGAACAGFASGLQIAASLNIATQENVLLVAADIRSKFLNLKDYNTSPLFGDGAAATLISSKKISPFSFKLRAVRSFSDGQHSDMIMIPGGGSAPAKIEPLNGKFYLSIVDGAKIFLKAREAFSVGSKNFLNEIDTSIKDIRYFVPHQANSLIIREVKKDLNFSDDQVIETIQETGNTSGASVGIALSEMILKKELNSGDLILIAAAGGGGIVSHALLECTR